MTGRDPYLIYHDLDDQFVPQGGGEAMPPPYPSRRQQVLYALAEFEYRHTARLAGAKFSGDGPKRPKKQEQERQ